jgi:hypothetical protein
MKRRNSLRHVPQCYGIVKKTKEYRPCSAECLLPSSFNEGMFLRRRKSGVVHSLNDLMRVVAIVQTNTITPVEAFGLEAPYHLREV